jgi:hypothetical protein
VHGLSRALVSAVLALGLTGSAQADVLGWEGTLQLHLSYQAFPSPPFVFTHDSGTFGGGGVSVNGSSGLGHLTTLRVPPQDFAGLGGQATVPMTDPYFFVTEPQSLRATAVFGGGTFAPISGAAASTSPLTQNTGPVPGIVKICILLPNCVSHIPIPLTAGGTRGMGLGGLITVGGFDASPLEVSVSGAPWTIKTVAVSGLPTTNGGFTTATAVGFAHGPESGTSSAADIGGVIQLVTPVRVETSVGGWKVLPLFGTLRIHITPEPGTLLLFGSGIAALAIAARRRSWR